MIQSTGIPYSHQHALTTKLSLVYSSGSLTLLVLDALGHIWKKQLVFAFTIEILPSFATSQMLAIDSLKAFKTTSLASPLFKV